MNKKHYYVFHLEQMPSGAILTIFEPFEFESREKANNHASFFHALCGLNYRVTDSLPLDMIDF